MSRRRTVAIASAAVLLALGGLLATAFATITSTDYGREKIRSFAEGAINRAIKGKIHIGRLSGSLFGNLTIDSLSLRQPNDSLFVATGPLHVTFDLRDIFDRRIYATGLRIERPYVHIHEDSTGTWNFRRIFPPGPPGPPRDPTVRKFGDYIVVDNAILDKAVVRVTMPWHPDDTLRAQKRDSAIAFNLERRDKIIRRVGGQYEQSWEWTNARLDLARARVDDRHPDGRTFEIRRLDVDEFYPPFQFREARGTARIDGDSLYLALQHFRLPGSVGRADGKVWWGSNLPTRYDVRVIADTVALADVNWVYPTLPKTGGGAVTLRIKNEKNLRVLDYALSDMDVRTMNSRLRGAMTFGTGGPILAVKDLSLRAEPLDFAFIHQLNGKPLPYPWKGTLSGTIRGPGGPLNRFRIDAADLTFVDANVPGAVARARGRGELDIFRPAFTVFRGFDLDLGQFDLRTIQFLNPSFPHFDGILAGRARLDSSWLDIRVTQADITHRLADRPENRFTGSARVTFGDRFLTYDVAVDAKPIALGTVAAAYRDVPIPFRGNYDGPIRLQGTLEDLAIVTELRGAAGSLSFDGRVDGDSVGGYGMRGAWNFSDVDLRTLFDTTAMPRTAFFGRADVDLTGDSLANLVGNLDLTLDRSLVDSLRLFGARARLRFADQRMTVDTLEADSPALTLAARGALGLAPAVRDSLAFAAMSDSLGGWRRLMVRYAPDSAMASEFVADTMAGRITANGVLFGSVDSLGLRGELNGDGLVLGEHSVGRVHVTSLVSGMNGDPRGRVDLRADTISSVGIRLDSLGARVDFEGAQLMRFGAQVYAERGPSAATEGTVRLTADTVDVGVQSLALAFADHRWELARPTRVVSTDSGVTVDSLRLDGGDKGELSLAGTIPRHADMAFDVVASGVSMGDLGELGQSAAKLGGLLDARLEMRGTRAAPVMQLTGQVREGKVGDVNLQRIILNGAYRDLHATGTLAVQRDSANVLDVQAYVPVDLRLEGDPVRLSDDTLHVGFRSRDVDLGILESFFPSLRNASGRMNADIALRGRTGQTSATGYFRIDSGAATIVPIGGERLRNVNVDIGAEGDTIRVRRLSVVSGAELRDSAWVTGTVTLPTERDTVPKFNLQLGAQSFHVVLRPRLADLEITGDLSLTGSERASVLTGGVSIDRGAIYVPDIQDKEVISLDDPELYAIVDTSVLSNRTLLPKAPPDIVRNLSVRGVQIRMGDEVWLRSDDANIKLGGAVNLTVAQHVHSPGTPAVAELALDGFLNTERGTYILALGPVQPAFTIEGGELRFFGDPDLNPTLNIRALHTVRTFTGTVAGRNEVRIRVLLTGTFLQPRVDLENADSVALSQSDLISYLVTGGPSLEIGGTGTSQAAVAAGFSFFSSLASRKLSGRYVDYVQIQGATQNYAGTSVFSSALFNGVQLGVGKQVTDRTFVSVQGGYCSAQSGATQTNPLDFQSIGFRVETRLTQGYGFSLSADPPSAAQFCALGFTSTPRQYGLDFYRAWRF